MYNFRFTSIQNKDSESLLLTFLKVLPEEIENRHLKLGNLDFNKLKLKRFMTIFTKYFFKKRP